MKQQAKQTVSSTAEKYCGIVLSNPAAVMLEDLPAHPVVKRLQPKSTSNLTKTTTQGISNKNSAVVQKKLDDRRKAKAVGGTTDIFGRKAIPSLAIHQNTRTDVNVGFSDSNFTFNDLFSNLQCANCADYVFDVVNILKVFSSILSIILIFGLGLLIILPI